MATMPVMRKLAKEYRLQADSIGEITDAFDAAVKKLVRTHGLTFGARNFKLRPGPLLNALILWFVELPEEQRRKLAVDSVARLERFLAESVEEAIGEAGGGTFAQVEVKPPGNGSGKKSG